MTSTSNESKNEATRVERIPPPAEQKVADDSPEDATENAPEDSPEDSPDDPNHFEYTDSGIASVAAEVSQASMIESTPSASDDRPLEEGPELPDANSIESSVVVGGNEASFSSEVSAIEIPEGSTGSVVQVTATSLNQPESSKENPAENPTENPAENPPRDPAALPISESKSEPSGETPLQTLLQTLPQTLPQKAIRFDLPDQTALMAKNGVKPQTLNEVQAETSSRTTASASSGSESNAEIIPLRPTDDIRPQDSKQSEVPPAESIQPAPNFRRSRGARLAIAAIATGIVLAAAKHFSFSDPSALLVQRLDNASTEVDLAEREPTPYEWTCRREKSTELNSVPAQEKVPQGDPTGRSVGQSNDFKFVSHQRQGTTTWQDVEWRANPTSNQEVAEFKAQAGDQIQIGQAECEVMVYGLRTPVRNQQLVQLPQLNSSALQARFFASVQNPAPVKAASADVSETQTQVATPSQEASTTQTDPQTSELGAEEGHPLSLSQSFVEISQKPSDASRVIEGQLILAEQDLDLRYKPSFETSDGKMAAPSLSLTRYQFEWSPSLDFADDQVRRLDLTSDGRFLPPSLPLGDSFVRVVDRLAQTKGPVTHLRVLEPPLRFETSSDTQLKGSPARLLKWKAHPRAAGYELILIASRSRSRNKSSGPHEHETERILHVNETQRVVASLQDSRFFWTVQAIDEQGLPLTTITSPRLETSLQKFILGDDGNRRHRTQDVDPRGLKISNVRPETEKAIRNVEPVSPLDGEVVVAGLRDREYGKLVWTDDLASSRAPAAVNSVGSRRPRFELQLATDADFVNLVFTKKTTKPNFKLKGDLPEGSLFYRVRSWPNGEWSSARKFQLVYE